MRKSNSQRSRIRANNRWVREQSHIEELLFAPTRSALDSVLTGKIRISNLCEITSLSASDYSADEAKFVSPLGQSQRRDSMLNTRE